ncbi:P-loop containing nucleoside triphosphate hydrolase protein [Nemania abortiva]|nr:P-loop containing nucleoside triphosphate hydrolase protein [Nemania abortiva]
MEQSDEQPKVLLVHKVICHDGGAHEDHVRESWFYDAPRLYSGDTKKSALRGERSANRLKNYLRRQFRSLEVEYSDDDDEDGDEDDDRDDYVKDVVVATVQRVYDCSKYHQSIEERFNLMESLPVTRNIHRKLRPYLFVLNTDGPEASSIEEKIVITNSNLLDLLRQVVVPEAYTIVRPVFPKMLSAPYLPIYYFLGSIQREIQRVENRTLQAQLAALTQYVLDANQDDYSEAEILFEQGRVNGKHFWKLFGPNQIVIQQKDDQSLAYMMGTLIENASYVHPLDCWSWSFDGTFRRRITTLHVTWPGGPDDEIDINSLSIYPLKHATLEVKEQLERRGKRVWDCRHRAYVSYRMPYPSFDVQTAQPRFMVDMSMYNELHAVPDKPTNNRHGGGNEILDPESMKRDDPPGEDFLLLLPEKLVGYGFQDKKWRTLKAEYISDIDWQTEAFDRLVLDQNKKEIIQALVSVHVSTALLKEPYDIIEGKGNSLIVLLHGSPGTGKTLTAESIAELTQKPLYRVTCGDMGLQPEAVEKYLDSVLYIGTAWGCVVLLDEADIFLEERTQADLQRNALVSVFLRVLEYYNGILILTTNRVGIFDEAFKSRIQLSIHYPPLDRESRLEIWLNFFNAMRAEDNIDLAGLKKKADRLAHYRINGRQIRNTVKSAKQLAYYKKEQLNYSHFDRIIRIANEFDRYIEKAHGGNTDEEWARDSHTRAEDCASYN